MQTVLRKQEIQIFNLHGYFSLTDFPIFFKIDRFEAIDEMDKLQFSRKSIHECRPYLVYKKKTNRWTDRQTT